MGIGKKIVIGFAICAGVGLIGQLFVTPPTAEERVARNKELDRSTAGHQCERVVIASLRDPDSWQLMNTSPTLEYKHNPKYDFSVIIRGRAKNGFGGYNTGMYACQFKDGRDVIDWKEMK